MALKLTDSVCRENFAFSGGKTCVWNISGEIGQRLEVTLLDTSFRNIFALVLNSNYLGISLLLS